ncbi:MAG: hypothetical protein ACRET8_07930, partial [Burkholderiales bacterium]
HTEACFAQLYRNQPLFGDLDRHLRSHGFAFLKFIYFGGHPFKPLAHRDGSSRHNQPLWCDVVYVRDYTMLDGLAPGQLLKFAAILHENYDAVGLASAALGAYDRKSGTALQAKYLDAAGPT